MNQWNVERFIERQMRGIREEVLESFDKPRARRLIVNSINEEDLLRKLGYTESTIQTYKVENKIDPLIRKLFDGMSFDDAKKTYTTKYLGT